MLDNRNGSPLETASDPSAAAPLAPSVRDGDVPGSLPRSRRDGSLRWLEELLAEADVELGGTRPWDIRAFDPSIADILLAQGSLGFGDAYVDGLWECDALDEYFGRALAARLEDRIKPNFALLTQIAKAKFMNLQSRARSLRVAEIHYNLGNEFYEAMLDPWMQYTCAYWSGGAKTLEEAQEAKLDLVCRKLDLRPGQKVLELGCGWGGFARFAASRYGVEVVAYNISTEQVAWARAKSAGLPVEIRLADYRDAQGSYDKVVSIGMCEHVGPKNYRTLMETVHRCLKPGGLFLLHTIGNNKEVPDNDQWLDAHIFPGAVLPSSVGLSRAFNGLFVLEDWHSFGPDYDKTLMAWHERFEASWPRFEAEYGPAFRRKWRYYLLMCAGTFRARKTQLWQLVLSKGGVPGGWTTVR
jgi:cyclopropane-fatty-acyl-phospholipid synthase